MKFKHKIRSLPPSAESSMLHFENAPKKATNLSLNSKVLETARDLGTNISQTVDTLLAYEVQRRYLLQWNDGNSQAFDHSNARIKNEGLPLEQYRSF